ncbi:hypothetical protein ABZX40_20480 [Streptomyces sp. NPDC004610]|uniref:hypothetical protein n=1 Tax=unclassified Streptomyces TaxID=2593676 RepID=UPI0033BCEEE3
MAGPSLVISLTTLLEYAIEPAAKNASGHVQRFDRLFQPDAVAQLDFQHPGVYALLLFHPVADAPIAEYVTASGALAADSGPRIMVFFTLGVPARAPVPLPAAARDPWLELEVDRHPAYAILRTLFAPGAPPALPGIVFLSGLDIDEESVYVPLPGLQDGPGARDRIAGALAVADAAVGQELRRKRFADDLAAALLRARIPYVRSGRGATREFLIRAFRVVSRHKGDLVTAVNLGVGKP